jgi:hypothetical protein
MLKPWFVEVEAVVTTVEVVASADYHYLQFPLSMVVHTQSQLAQEAPQPILAEQALLHTTTQFMPQLVVVEAPTAIHYSAVVAELKGLAQWDFLVIFGQQ